MAKATSIDASILLSYIFSLMEHHDSMEMYNSSVTIQKFTALSKRSVEKAVSLLVTKGLIKKTIKGSPPVTFFMFDDECHHNLNHTLLQQESREKHKNTDNQTVKVTVSDFVNSQYADNQQFHRDGQLISPNDTIDFTRMDNKEYINKSKENIKEIKLHSSRENSSEFSAGGDTKFSAGEKEVTNNNLPENKQNIENLEIPIQELKKTKRTLEDKYKITEAEKKHLMTYHKGLLQTLDLHAKVKFNRSIENLYKIYININRNLGLLTAVYTYFRTYRDFDKEFVLDIRSLRSLEEKFDKLISEMKRETTEYIQKNKSIVLHINHEHEKPFLVIYQADKFSASDSSKISSLVQMGYRAIKINPEVIKIDLEAIEYNKKQNYAQGI